MAKIPQTEAAGFWISLCGTAFSATAGSTLVVELPVGSAKSLCELEVGSGDVQLASRLSVLKLPVPGSHLMEQPFPRLPGQLS